MYLYLYYTIISAISRYALLMTMQDILLRAGDLPAAAIAEQLDQALADHAAAVVTAPPGAGKSTLLPLTLLAGLDASRPAPGRILVLEPRRIAARAIAERLSDLLGETVGATAGYRVRFEKRVSAQTRIEVLTEGILSRMVVADPTLEGVDMVVFDEFHERSIHSDLALALVRQVQQIVRPDLKIVIMSATIDAAAICRELHAPLVECEGRMYPVEVHHAAKDIEPSEVAETVAETVQRAYRNHAGNILAFLPGQGEITRCAELLEGALEEASLYPLYGNLSSEQQRRAIAPSRGGERKVVLATPIAETSLTIEGVRVVVDGGFCRTLVVDHRTGLSRLETVRISRDMAAQRAGRAGRVAEGVCYRLWTSAVELRMAEQRKPELEEADLASLLLEVAAFGERDVMALPWLTPPPMAHVVQARQLLTLLGALSADGSATPLGSRMAQFPCHPRISRMILAAQDGGCQPLACDIAALLEEKDPLVGDTAAGTDMAMRINLLREARRRRQPGRWNRVLQVAAEYLRMTHSDADNAPVSSEEVGALVAYAYPERVAMATDDIGHYRLAGGDNVQLDRSDPMTAFPLLAVASLHAPAGGMGRAFLAAAATLEALLPLSAERDNLSWDSRQGCVVMQRERRLGKLLLAGSPLKEASAEQVTAVICNAVAKEGLTMLDWNEAAGRLQRRVAQAAAWHPELELPDCATEHLMASAAAWLPPFLADASGRIRTTVADLRKIDLCTAIASLLTYEQQQAVDRIAPSHLTVPTGSRIRIDYRQGSEAPVLSVRLQECFGLTDTPLVNEGRQPVLMELLSPGFKPVQLTQDLRSFWQGTYFEVRKELKRRYPKHSWPDNPLDAPPTRRAKPNPAK